MILDFKVSLVLTMLLALSSALYIGIPNCLKMEQTKDLPLPMPPVIPNFNNKNYAVFAGSLASALLAEML